MLIKFNVDGFGRGLRWLAVGWFLS